MDDMQQSGNCAWPKCKQTGENWLEDKCCCEKHYDIVVAIVNNKPVGKTAMGASTTVINE